MLKIALGTTVNESFFDQVMAEQIFIAKVSLYKYHVREVDFKVKTPNG